MSFLLDEIMTYKRVMNDRHSLTNINVSHVLCKKIYYQLNHLFHQS